MTPNRAIAGFATDHPILVSTIMVVTAAALITLVALPYIAPDTFSSLNKVQVDTDPENMLSKDEPVRVFHNHMKKVFDLHDIVVVGVVNDEHPEGVFNVQSLTNIYELTEFAETLRGEALGLEDPKAGVIAGDVIAPSTVDNIEQGGPGEVRFEWLMSRPPETEQEAVEVRDKAQRIPFLSGTMVSESGKAVAIYLPVSSKDVSHRVYAKLNEKIAGLPGNDEYHITGLPVANDVFGVEMFKQMAISAPLAMLVIFLLMLAFFRKLVLIVSPLILALFCVIYTMTLLVATGNTIHIMSSMIPIFIMPIAVLDSIHILSEFFDRYQDTRDRRETIFSVMDALFVPMLYTSLTSAAGFASLALTPIPPVQVFGIFVAIGVMVAWFLTIVFIPAFVMFIPEKRLENFGAKHTHEEEEASRHGVVGWFLSRAASLTYNRAKLVLTVAAAAVIIAIYGIFQIQINDNPTRWFKSNHPIRVADRVLNKHFGGTYMAYLALRPPEAKMADERARQAAMDRSSLDGAEAPQTPTGLDNGGPGLPAGLGGEEPALPSGMAGDDGAGSSGPDDTEPSVPAGLGSGEDEDKYIDEIFKEPDVLNYIARLQEHLLSTGVVGKSSSITDIVKTVHRELIDGSPAAFRVPDSIPGVAQTMMQYQSSHRPGDLWHFVTPDYREASVWVQLKSGDNKDMEGVVRAVDEFAEQNPPPAGLELSWYGLTYINVVWQDKMVSGMLNAFIGSFLVVLLMMTVLFRSALWGVLCMIPLTITIGFIYGLIGLIGKDYDMPVAVLSSLTLGMAVDFAIHFLARSRELYAEHGTWEKTYEHVFGEPARAIARNVIVIAVGFTPLLAAPLRPYVTVGFFLAAILLISGVATLLILPAFVRLLERFMYPKTRACCLTCNCVTCTMSAVTALLLIVLNVHQFLVVGITTLTWLSVAAIVVLGALCCIMSRRAKCKQNDDSLETG